MEEGGVSLQKGVEMCHIVEKKYLLNVRLLVAIDFTYFDISL